MEKGEATAVPQNEEAVTFAPMLDKSLCPIDWSKTAQQVHDHVRGLNPWPVATAKLGARDFRN